MFCCLYVAYSRLFTPVIPSICIFVCYCRHINCFKETLRD